MDYPTFQQILWEEADSIPEKFYEGLNGGVIISREEKLSPYARGNDLWIAGEYQIRPVTGNQIVIYYGSMMRLYYYYSEEQFRLEIRRVLRHELKHHVEGRAGYRGLEIQDQIDLARYLKKWI